MKKIYLSYLFIVLGFATGLLFFLIEREYILIQCSFFSSKNNLHPHITTKRNIILYCWNGHKVLDHQTSLVWHRARADNNVTLLVSTWLQFAHQENIITDNIDVECAFVSPQHPTELYLSFNHSPLSSQWSIQKKIFFIESLLKTITQAQFPFQHIIFLVNHQPMSDEHLDFSYPWPLAGFVELS